MKNSIITRTYISQPAENISASHRAELAIEATSLQGGDITTWDRTFVATADEATKTMTVEITWTTFGVRDTIGGQDELVNNAETLLGDSEELLNAANDFAWCVLNSADVDDLLSENLKADVEATVACHLGADWTVEFEVADARDEEVAEEIRSYLAIAA